MIWPDFVPIEMSGMSVITAMALFTLISGGVFVYRTVSAKLSDHDKMIDNIKTDLNKINISLAEIKVIVHSMDDNMSNMANINKEAMKLLLERK